MTTVSIPALPIPNKNTPWRLSEDVFKKVSSQDTSYSKVEILPSDPEFAFVYTYFHHQTPTNRAISHVYCLHSPRQTTAFESNIPILEQQATNAAFQPKWTQEGNVQERQKVMSRFQKTAAQFTPFTITWNSNKKEHFKHVRILPLWHGSTAEKCQSISETGFTYFGKHKEGQSQSTDQGYFGSGIYFTNSARYAADIYSDKEHLLLGWVSMREPYPVINDKPPTPQGHPKSCTDMTKLQAKGAFENYNAHYIPVRSTDSNSPQCTVYYPCPATLEPTCDELVVFQPSQTLPRFWIEMCVDLPKNVSYTTLETSGELLTTLFDLLENSTIQAHPSLSQALHAKVEALIELSESSPLTPEDQKVQKIVKRLVSKDQKVNDTALNMLLKCLTLEPSLQGPVPASSFNLPSLHNTPLPFISQKSSFYLKMNDKKIVLKDIKTIPVTEFISALQQEPHNATLYANLGRILPSGGDIRLLDGTVMTQQQLFLKAISLDPTNSYAYIGLGATLPSGGNIRLPDGTVMTQQQLFLKAISLDPTNSYAYTNLGATLPSGGNIRLPDGTVMTQQQLFLKAISLDPTNSYAYTNLGATLPSGGNIRLPDGTVMTEQQLFLKAISLDPTNSTFYTNLGATLLSGGNIRLLDGTVMTQQQLYLKALSLDPTYSRAYHNLGTTVPSGGSIQLLDGTVMTQQQLFLKAISLDPTDSYAYTNLGHILSSGGSIQLLDGTVMTEQQLYLKAISLDPTDSYAYHNLGTTVPSGGSIRLLDGTVMTQQQLYLKAKSFQSK